ncbi:MAG: hypothetical protein ACHQ50_03755 [Fimbriimonadales bacterium]
MRSRIKVFALLFTVAFFQLGWGQESTCYEAVAFSLDRSGGRLTREVRDAYLKWAEDQVVRGIKGAGLTVPTDSLAEVDADPTLRDAIFASVFPPDPSILQNYAQLRALVDPAGNNYRSLLVALAVSRRVKRVEPAADVEAGLVGSENIPPGWGDHILQGPPGDGDRKIVGAIADFMRKANVSALDLYSNPTLQSQLAVSLGSQGISRQQIGECHKSVQFGERLKWAIVELGQRPSAREKNPPAMDWAMRLIGLLESKPRSTPDGIPWPIFPVKTSPWPLLMPLAHEVPVSEADFIWRRFVGEDGPDRFHTYGPYRFPDDTMPDMLRPSKWFWSSYPDQIVHGGTCIPISDGTMDLYAALGQPAVWAGQPAHANLISYRNVGGVWQASIEQAFAGGPEVTCADWWFHDPIVGEFRFGSSHTWPISEYNLGLALAMNCGVDTYIDTRIATGIFQSLPSDLQGKLGLKLLESVTEENPFNPEVWYRLAALPAGADETIELFETLASRNPASFGHKSAAIEGLLQNESARGALDQYWGTLSPVAAGKAFASRTGVPAKESNRKRLLTAVEHTAGLSADAMADVAERFTDSASAQDAAVELKTDQDLATANDSFGLMRMAQRYRDGDGVDRDETRASRLLLQAATQGDPVAGVLLDRLYPPLSMAGVAVAASSTYSPTQDVRHLVDGSGLAGGFHDNSVPAATMWHTPDHPVPSSPGPGIASSPAWVQFVFPNPVAFDAVKIWNHNQLHLTDRGMKTVRIYGTLDGSHWFNLTRLSILPRASGGPREPGFLIPSIDPGRFVKSVIIAADPANGNYGSAVYGLSAVHFLLHRLEPAISAANIRVATSSENSPVQSGRHLVDGSGTAGQWHDNDLSAATMWTTKPNPPAAPPAEGLPASPAWVRFDFNQPRTFARLQIWNNNQANFSDRGLRRVAIYGSSDGRTWRSLTGTAKITLPPAPGNVWTKPVSIANALAERPLVSVIIAADPTGGNYGGDCYGLSEVRFVIRP